MVGILLRGEDVNPNLKGSFGETPLHYAAMHGWAGVVGSLLVWSDIDPHQEDENGDTPLSLANKNGHTRVVRLLALGVRAGWA